MGPPGMPGAMGPSGAVGETRNPVTIVLLGIVTCGIYWYYWLYYKLIPELRAYLGRTDEYNPLTQMLISMVCGIMFIINSGKAAGMVFEAQQRAGRPGAQDKTNTIWICWAIQFITSLPAALAVPFILQTETNKVWNPQQQ